MTPAADYILDARTATPHFPGIGRYVRGLAGALPDLLEPSERLRLLVDPGHTPAPGVQVSLAAASPFGLRQQWQVPPSLEGAAVYHSPYFLMPYRPGVPTVLTLYDLIPHRLPRTVPLRARLIISLALPLALRAAGHLIAISEATRADFLDRFPRLPPARITAIPLAAGAAFRPRSEPEIAELRRRYRLPAEFVLYVGSNKPHKNLVTLVRAWSELPVALPLVIAGAWDDRYPEPRREAAGQSPDRTRFLGPIRDEDLPALYSACRLFVFPSLYEGFGLPVLEALACGAEVVCSNTSSLPEVGGAAAAYFDPTDPGSLRRAVLEALARPPDPGRSLRQAARFSWTHTAGATLEIYRSLAYNEP